MNPANQIQGPGNDEGPSVRPLEPVAVSESLVADEMGVDFEPTSSGCQTTIAPSSVGEYFAAWQAAGPWPRCKAALAEVLRV